ncbi:hypothetical protein SDRG_11489 [Saprolegnia diclina VS20]|uniref:3-beta hydroxysteroid dehydrogenase/isomerase domain-containing protein n=1 Tax=Saprolegnia diclina (strain VS20) TaxID=1156394 RepID=T0QB20_SAPDV|nr:hypothetical protein SDRG_11489 [Saprolegnia diclina VS20]EQC30730.1 hypothetical protein SDRG_11489 [Saprolegnia diclina VS20]|eukprot:XP_008615754.1 hypothetical protein SDRG_11489 [Saprolegnia diclina VS20]
MTATVCVTGGAGFLGSYVVKRLLEKGYHVKATVRDPTNAAKVAHLRALPGASDRLELFAADLLQPGAFDKAVEGCAGVFHTASPVQLKASRDALVAPAVQGTLNVLTSCARVPSIRRVVLTSSVSAVYMHCGTKSPDHIFTEADWSPKDRLEANAMWYPLSKTLAEEAAIDFVETQRPAFDLVAMCPAWIFGPMLPPSMNESSDIVRNLFNAHVVGNLVRNVVDVRNVADAHVAGFENTKAHGRYLLIAHSSTEQELCDGLRIALPTLADQLPTARVPDAQMPKVRFDCRKAMDDLGLRFFSLQETLEATCVTMLAHGFLNAK